MRSKELNGQFNGMAFPQAKMVSERLLTIPTHQFLSERDKEEICRLFKIHGAISASDIQQKNVEDLSGRHPESGEHEAYHYN